MVAKNTTVMSFKSFDWDSITQDDAVSYDRHGKQIVILKGFRKDTNNYERIVIKIPPRLVKAIWAEAIDYTTRDVIDW